jgi:Electron transfer DM13
MSQKRFERENRQMQTSKVIVGSIIVVVVAIAWYLFRPELLFVTKTVNEALPGSAATASAPKDAPSVALATGRFHSVAHETSGTATVHQLANGTKIVRRTEFETSNGPDVRVYLVAAKDASDNETVTRAGFVDLGAMKGNKGDQNYEVPTNIDLGRYQAVTIWCRRFGVNFATAPMTPQKQI